MEKEKKDSKFIYNFIIIIFVLAVILLCIISCISIISGLIKGERLNEILSSIIDGIKVIGGFELVIFIIGSVIMIVGELIESAVKDKMGKAYQIVRVINVICITFLIFIGISFLADGLRKLYKDSIPFFYAFVSAALFSFYYWIKKKNFFQ